MTDFLSTQRTATSATTRPALTTLFVRILAVTPIWVALTLPPLRIVTTKRVVLLFGTIVLSWHSRVCRVTRTLLWRSAAVRRLARWITGLHFEGPEKPTHAAKNDTKADGKTPSTPEKKKKTSASASALTAAIQRRRSAYGKETGVSLQHSAGAHAMTDFLSTQRTATSATTRPALTTLFVRILAVTPIWVALTLPPLRIVTTKRVVLLFGTIVLSWHSRVCRVTRTLLWRSAAVRRLARWITGLHFEGPEKPTHAAKNDTKADGKTPSTPEKKKKTSASASALTAAIQRRRSAYGKETGVRCNILLEPMP